MRHDRYDSGVNIRTYGSEMQITDTIIVILNNLSSVMFQIAALSAGKYVGWNWMDPVMGIVGAVLITRWSWDLLKDTSCVLLDQQRSNRQQ